MTKNEKLLSEALDRFKKCEDFERENRDLAAEDFRFAAGYQWPDDVRRQREIEGRPCLTFNRLPQFIAQVIGDARQNKPAIKVHPVDSGADEDTAELYNGLIRNIESQSRASQAYITAFEHAVTGSMGAWRVTTEYSTDDAFDQDIRIRRITNPFAVFWDPNAREYDKSDAKYCFVSEWVTKEYFEATYPGETPADSGTGIPINVADNELVCGEKVRLSEYWVKVPVTKKIGLWEGQVVEIHKDSALDMFEQIREVKSHRVVRYLLSGHAVLEGPSDWAGEHIPIIPVFGPEEFVDDRSINRSLIRYAKDPMRMYNYWQSTIAEKVSNAPKSPWLVTPQMIAGLERFWNAANVENRAYLPYNPDPSGQRPERQAPAFVNSAEIQQSMQAVEDLKATMGIHDASLGAQGNETSGRAILARQREGDNATFSWIDNLARSIQHTGRILVDLIPKIYDTQRVVRILGEDESAEMLPINTVDPITGEKINALDVGKYDVEIIVGPSYATKRLEAAESMLAFIQAIPQAAQISGDLIAKAMDWPGAEAIAERLKRALPPGMVDEEMTPEQQQQQQMAMQAQQEAEQIQKAATAADIEEKQAKATKAQAEAEGQQLENAKMQMELAAMTGQIQDMVRAEVIGVLQGMMQPQMMPDAIPQ